jgi:hypothetical protein
MLLVSNTIVLLELLVSYAAVVVVVELGSSAGECGIAANMHGFIYYL